ncbi:MAG: hypothetical protein HYU66_24020 [Armatimonadetes bacterium]|nr:hypothetical protein [Armatimonadota bacterium]
MAMRANWVGLALVIWLASEARADDGAISGVGGAPKLMKEHPSVRMVRETVEIWVPEGRVVARFTFRNLSRRPADVLMGFPESSWGDAGSPHSTFVYFHSYVDGRLVRARRVAEPHERGGGYSAFWLKRVHFSPGGFVEVLNRYAGGLGFVVGGLCDFEYTLRTGASWHGSIGRARVICHLDPYVAWGYEARPGGYHRRGNAIVWDWSDLDPQENISLGWYPDFLGLTVDQRPARQADCWKWAAASGVREVSESQRVRRVGDDIRLPARCAETWLRCALEVTHQEPWQVRYTRKRRSVTLTEGSRIVRANGLRRRLAWTPRERHGALIVRLRPIVEGLGGTMYWSWQQQRFIVWLPAK